MTQPSLTREGIAVALFSLMEGLPGVVTHSRRVKLWNKVMPAEHPAVFQGAGKQEVKQSSDGNTAIWRYSFEITVYCHNADQKTSPSSQVNDILDAIEERLAPQKGQGPPGFNSMQHLGDTTGRIRHAWIVGDILTDEGTLGDQALATCTVEVEVI